MKSFVNTLKDLFGYTIVVQWDGLSIIHYAWTRADALEWMAAYPSDARVTVLRGLSEASVVCQRRPV